MLISTHYKYEFTRDERKDLSTEMEELSTIGRTISTSV
jgi:hypothetical protein